MLESEEVDQDYFTPAASTTLANIFDNSQPEEKPGNDSLRYIPPKPQVVSQAPKQKDDNPGLEPIFKCSLVGHQWINNVYSAKGTIGCSIVKLTKDAKKGDMLYMVLYDLNKHTLLSLLLTHRVHITIKELDFISFYESNEKFWSLHGSKCDIKTITEYCKTKNVQLKFSEEQETISTSKEKRDKTYIESDIESDEAEPKKPNNSLLSRMANMGKAILPHPQFTSKDDMSSSNSETDSNSIRKHNYQSARHIVKTNILEESNSKPQTDADNKVPVSNMDYSIEDSNVHSELILKQNTKIDPIDATTSSVNLFLTELRVSNSELRININRLSDKVDKVLMKINNLEDSTNGGSSINTEILLKLLKEYESKIKKYEELIDHESNISSKLDDKQSLIAISNENAYMTEKIKVLESTVSQKDDEILKLNNKIKQLQQNISQDLFNQEKDELVRKNLEIEQLLQTKNELLDKITHKLNNTITNRIKSIMNDTYHGIVENINDENQYSGEDVKNIVEKVMKNVTIVSLKNHKDICNHSTSY